MILVLLCLIAFAVWSILSRKCKKHSHVVFPGALPIIGHAYQLIGDLVDIFKFEQKLALYALEKGEIVEVRFGKNCGYVITDLEDSLTVANACLDKPYMYDLAKEHYQHGLITAKVSSWKPHRKLLNPSFSPQMLFSYMEEYNVQARSLVTQLKSEAGKGAFDVRKYLTDFLLKTVSRLNIEDQHIIDTVYAESSKAMLGCYAERFQKFWLQLPFLFNRSSLKKKQDKLSGILKGVLWPIIEKRRKELKSNGNCYYRSSLSGKFKPLLNQLLDLAENHEDFTDEVIRQHLDTVVFASYDTTASSLTYTLILLGTYQEVQQRAYKEICEVLGDQDNDVTKRDLSKLVYLDAVIKEALRCCPVVPLVARSCLTDIKLKNFTLPAGSLAILGLYAINRLPVWGADANNFNPERWLNPATLPDNSNAFASFSIGKRNCIGKNYAMIVMKTTLAQILREYHVTANFNNVVSECDIVARPVLGHHISLSLRNKE